MSDETSPVHLDQAQLEAGLDEIRRSPKDEGRLELLVRRPEQGGRESLEVGELDETVGLVGDNWSTRGCRHTADGSAHPLKQINIMNARSIALIARERSRWALAGDQLFVDLDLSEDNLPPGTRLSLGEAILEVTPEPHNGCKKFVGWFGHDAMRFVNSPLGKELHLRGVNAKVVQSGTIRVGDVMRKQPQA